MALPAQNLYVPVGGLETEIDDKLLPLGKMLDLENAYMPRLGEAVKRFGNTRLPDPLTPPFTLATHKGALVGLPYADPIEVLPTPTSTEWVKGVQSGSGNNAIAGAMASKMSVSLSKVAASKANTGGEGVVGDVAYGAGFYFVAYIDGTNSQILHFTAVDASTMHVTMDTTVSRSTDFRAYRVIFQDNRGVLAWWDSGNAIGFVTLNPAVTGMAPTTVGTAATPAGVSFMLNAFDMTTRSTNTAVVAYRDNTGNVSAIDFVPSTGVVTLWQPRDQAGAVIPAPGTDVAIAWMQDDGGSGKQALIVIHNTNGLSVHWNIPSVGATRQAAITYAFPTVTGRAMATGFTTDNNAAGHFVVVYNQGGPASDTTAYVGIASNLPAVGQTTGPILYRGATLRSKTFLYNGDHFIVVAWPSATQGTHYVVKVPITTTTPTLAPPLAMFAVRQGTGSYFSSVAFNVSTGNTYTVSIGYTLRVGTSTVANTFGVQLATIKFQQQRDTDIGQPKEAVDSLLVPGGILRQFDGVTYGEEGFAYPPEPPTLTPAAAGSGVTENSDYYYALVYERLDAQGRRWQSDASVPKLVHTGAGQRQVTVACPTLRLTGWSNVQIGIYRGSQGVFDDLRKIAVVANNISVDTVSYIDIIPDATQSGGEPIYTEGGVLGNDTHPGFIAVCIAQNRMWGIPADDPQSVWYTKEFVVGHGLEWSEDFVVDVRDERGPLRGLAVIDNKPISWKDDALYVGLGTGPNILDQGGTYVFEVSSRGFGSSNAIALLETKDGAMFVSTSQRAGIFLLDRALSAQYIGAPVQRYISEQITAGIYVSKLNQARFYTASGRTLVYDVVNGQWSTFTGQPCDAAVSWNGVPVFVKSSNGHMLYEDLQGLTYTDDGSAYTSLYGWPWVQINQAKGYQRFRAIQPVGERADVLTGAQIKLYQDFNDTTPFLTTNLLNAAGTLDQMLRYSSKLAALKVVISDPSPTAGLKISGYTAIIGAKQGLRKQAARIP